MDFFFQLSDRHAKEQIQFQKDYEGGWNNLIAKYKGHENIPSQENQQFRKNWGQQQKDMTARQFNELSNIAELEKEQKAREQGETRKKTDDLEIDKPDALKEKEVIQKAELDKKDRELSSEEIDKLNGKLLPENETALKEIEARATQEQRELKMQQYLKEAQAILERNRQRDRER